MTRLRSLQTLILVLCGLMLAAGCRRPPQTEDSEALVDFQLGNMLKPHDTPSLEAVESQAAEGGGWVDRPVINSLQRLRDHLAQETPLGTVEQALSVKNDSDENNALIKSALGQPPKDDSQVNYDATFARHTLQSLKSTNPLLASSTTEQEVYGLTAVGLFSFDWNMVPFAVTEYVKSWQTSPDGLMDKVVLRDDLVWSDGTPITARDVEFSFRVIMTEQIPIPAVRAGTDKILQVKAYDDHTLVFFHPEALETNVWNLNFPVIPKHKYESTIAADPTLVDSDAHVELENNPVFGGPYKIISRSPTEVVLEAREDFYMHQDKQVRDRPHFKTIRLRINPDSSTALLALKAGDVDSMVLEAAQWTSQTSGDDFYEKNTKARAVEWVSFSFFWNMKSPYFTDRRVRQALTYAFDHDEMLQTLRFGRDYPCTGTFHPTSAWHPGPNNAISSIPEPVKMDRERAKQLLDEAGWTDTDGDGYRDHEIGGKRRKFEFTMLVRNQKERVDICELLKQNLRPLGIAVNIRPLESATLQDKMFKREFDAAYGGWGAGADPDTSVNIWGSGQDRNYVGYSNPIVDEMFAEGCKLQKDRRLWKDLKVWADAETRDYLGLDPALADKQPQRADCYAAIQAILWRDQPYTWLFYRNGYFAFNKQLRGYFFSPRGPFTYSPGASAVWAPQQ